MCIQQQDQWCINSTFGLPAPKIQPKKRHGVVVIVFTGRGGGEKYLKTHSINPDMQWEAECGSMISKRVSTPVRAVIVRKPGSWYGGGFHCSLRKGQKARFIDPISFCSSISHHVDHILHICYYAIVVEPSPDFRPISNSAVFRSRLTRGHQHCLFVFWGDPPPCRAQVQRDVFQCVMFLVLFPRSMCCSLIQIGEDLPYLPTGDVL